MFGFWNQALSYSGPSGLITKQDALLARAENSEKAQNIQAKISVFIPSHSYKVTCTLRLNCSFVKNLSLAWSYKILTRELFFLWNKTPWTICSIYSQFMLPNSLKKLSPQMALKRWRQPEQQQKIANDLLKNRLHFSPTDVSTFAFDYEVTWTQNSDRTCWSVYRSYTMLVYLTDVNYFPLVRLNKYVPAGIDYHVVWNHILSISQNAQTFTLKFMCSFPASAFPDLHEADMGNEQKKKFKE